jgi:hypothetical protein
VALYQPREGGALTYALATPDEGPRLVQTQALLT